MEHFQEILFSLLVFQTLNLNNLKKNEIILIDETMKPFY